MSILTDFAIFCNSGNSPLHKLRNVMVNAPTMVVKATNYASTGTVRSGLVKIPCTRSTYMMYFMVAGITRG